MKKIILITTLAFALSFSFAQTTAPVDTCKSDTVKILNPATLGPIPPKRLPTQRRKPQTHAGMFLYLWRNWE